jgi:predicted MPP superfamily phosphohydrolase
MPTRPDLPEASPVLGAPRGALGDAIGRYLAGGAERLHLAGLPVLPAVPTTLAVTAAALVAGVAGMAAVWRGPERAGGALAVVLGLAATAGVGVMALAVLVPGGLRFFGIVHLAYLGLVVSVPMVGLAAGARALAGRGSVAAQAPIAVALLLPAAVGWYATHVAPFRLVVDRVSVPLDPARSGHQPVRIGVLADLQTNDVGGYEHGAVDRLLAEQPDLILLPGDLFQGSPSSFAAHEEELRRLLGRLHAPHGVWFVRGDVDRGDYADRALRGTGIAILDDEIVDITVGDRHLQLGGNRLAYADPAAGAVRRALEAADDGRAVRILVAHRPDAALDLAPGSRVDLTVAGHTHGGQVVVPGFGPLLTMSAVPRQVAAGGLREVDGNAVYVATGVGMERNQAPQVRLFSRPSIGVLELR